MRIKLVLLAAVVAVFPAAFLAACGGSDNNGGDSGAAVVNTKETDNPKCGMGNGQKATGTMRFQAAGPRAVTGTVDVVATNGTRTMTIKNTIQGKWLSADCGTLKPGETRRVP